MEAEDKYKNITLKYTLGGFLFGVMFPFMSCLIIIFTTLEEGQSLVKECFENPLFLVICLAPFVLSYVSYLVSKNFLKNVSIEINEKLKLDNVIKINSEFAQEIGKGNLNIEINNSSKDILTVSLLEMKQSLIQSVEKEEERNWIIKGETELSDILRANNNLNNLGEEIAIYLTKKVNAVQCAFFIVNDYDTQNITIDLLSSYAFGRKKYLKSQFKPKQGLVGQAYLERELIYRTEIPDNYLSISSGLIGDKKPKSLVVLPLITNETCYGLIEMASINPFTQLQLNFLSEISDIIARTIFNIKVNENTLKLLNESQELSNSLQIQQIELQTSNEKLATQIQEVENAQKRQNVLLESSSEIISIFDGQGKAKYESPSIQKILGYTAEEVISGEVGSIIHTEDRSIHIKNLVLIKSQPEKTISFKFRCKHKDGHFIWMEATLSNQLNNPAINGIVMNSRDITIALLAEKEQSMRGKMQSLSENSLDVITRLSLDGILFYTNPMITNVTGLLPANIYQKHYRDIEISEELKMIWTEILQLVQISKHKNNKEYELLVNDEKRIYSFNSIPEFNEKNELETVLIVSHDITEQKKIELEIKETNKKITESINYSHRIQTALLPTEKELQYLLPQSFFFYLPKDTVSGDFPYLFVKENTVYIAAVDCTGHGVPGALMSFIGHFAINQIMAEIDTVVTASQILDRLHFEVQRTLKQDTGESTAKDGMDMALLKINLETNEIEYAGAHRPLYIVKDGIFYEIKGDKYPIAGMHYKNRQPFVNHILQLSSGDSVFINTDGLPDQFGGANGKEKFMSRKVREIIENNHSKNILEMKQVIHDEFYGWMGKYKQMDDVLMIGIKF